jgi:hypothetical protein
MTKAPLIQIWQHNPRATAVTWLSTVFLLSGFLLSTASAQTGLPRTAISIPTDGSIPAGLQSVEDCATNHDLIVLPPVAFGSEANESISNSLSEQTQAISNAAKGSDLWLHVIASGNSLTGGETEKQLTDRVDTLLTSMPLASPDVHGLIIEVNEPRTSPDLYAFELLRLALTAKSDNSNLKLAFVFPRGFIDAHADLVKRLALYANLLGISYSADWHKDAAWVAENALNKPLILKLDTDASATDSSRLAAELAASGTSVEILWPQPSAAMTAAKACALDRFMQHVVPSNMLRLNSSSVPFKLTVDGKESDEPLWFGNGQSPDLAMVARINANSDHPRQLALTGNAAGQYEVQWFDPETGNRTPAIESTGPANRWTQTLSSTSEYLVVSFHKHGETDSTVYNSVEVKSGVSLSVEEIIARWQQYSEAQKQKLENYVSSSFMNLHFESTNVVSAFDVSMQLKQFYDRSNQMELAQTALYVNGVKFNNKYEFPLPQLEPEKVLAPPLELKLSENYSYKLLGTEQVNGAQCYVVGVEPKVQDATLYSGKIWIDGTTFREVKQTLHQRGDKSNIVANIETQNYELVSDGKGNHFNLLHSISEQQTLNAAGRDFLLQRTIQFSGYEINTSQFSNSLAAERNSQDPMYRDTEQGLRTLKKQGNERILVQDTRKRIESIVGGAMYQGTFNFPIPIAGLTLSDFDYRHTGAQLSTFYAGVLLATDLSKQFGNKYRLSGDLALSAVPGEDRLYTGNTEDTGAQIYAWSESTGVRAAWLATPHLSLTASTYLEYDFFHAASDTSNQYIAPRNGVALLPGAQIRFTDRGYTFTANGTRAQRFAWKPFGCIAASLQPDGCSPPHKLESGYTLYDADINKDYYFRKFTKGGWDLAYFGGNQQDRFSRYYPSIFSQPNVHGIPSGTDSFDAIAMASVHYGFNIMDIIKLDEMYSYTRARNLEESSHFRKFDGLETRVNTPGPFGTLIQSTVSYALDGNIARYNSRWGVLFMIFKPLH